MKTRYLAQAICAIALAAASFAASAADHVFSNATPLTISDNAGASVYPSTIAVGGIPGSIDEVTVTLHGLSHTFVGDLNVVLVSPTGQSIGLLRRVGREGTGFGWGVDFVNADITFSPAGTGTIPNINPIASGTYLPSGADATNSFAPAPVGPYSPDLTLLNGTGASQAGNWSLYVSDHAGGDTGQLAGGWSINFRTTTTCASEGYTGTKLEWCKNICERGYTGSTLAMWIRRWTDRYRTLPYCALEPQPE